MWEGVGKVRRREGGGGGWEGVGFGSAGVGAVRSGVQSAIYEQTRGVLMREMKPIYSSVLRSGTARLRSTVGSMVSEWCGVV